MKKFFLIMIVLTLVFVYTGFSQVATEVEGTWDFYYDWGCNGVYYQTTITFGPWNNYFSTGNGNSGSIYVKNEEIIMHFTYSGTIYTGNKVGGVMTGMMKTNGGSKGCWYMVKQGYNIPQGLIVANPPDESGQTTAQRK